MERTKIELIEIDKILAAEWQTFNVYEYQRALRPKHVHHLKEKMNKGEFLAGDIAFAEENGNNILINGQHQLKAFLASNRRHLMVRYMKFKCKDARELAHLYRRFDSNKIRSHGDCLYAEARALGKDWPKRIISLVGAGIVMVENKRDIGRDERIELFSKYLKDGEFINEMLQPCLKHMARAPVIYAMIKTGRISETDAARFWSRVRDGDNLPTRSPIKKLRDYLLTARAYRGSGKLQNVLGVRLATDHEIASKCITAWNAFRNGGTTALKYFIHKSIPEPL